VLPLDDVNKELRRITILERNTEYYDAAEMCFNIHRQTHNSEVAMRGFNNLWASAWNATTLSTMSSTLSEIITRLENTQENLEFNPEQRAYLQALSWEAKGWLADPPNPDNLKQAVDAFIQINEITRALDLITSLVAFVEPDQQVELTKYGIKLTEQLSPEAQDTYYLLLVEPLLLYVESNEKETLLQEIFQRTQTLSQIQNRSPMGNIAVLHGVDLLLPHQVEPTITNQIQQENVHELVRSLMDTTHNRLRGMMFSLLGSSYNHMAETEQDPELRQDLFEKAKDYYLQSVSTFDCTPAYGERLRAYTLAGTGFLSIAELEHDVERRNDLIRLGREHLQKSRKIGEMTQLYQLRARAAINLGVALERVTWFDMNPESRQKKLLEIFNLQIEGRDLAKKTMEHHSAGYATIYASEMCGFLSDLETRIEKKREWASKQRKLSQIGLELLNQTPDIRGQVEALSYTAFACAKLADLTPAIDEKSHLFQEMLQYGEIASNLSAQVPDPIATAFAHQQAGEAAIHLGILKGDINLLMKATSFFDKASKGWSHTGERHKQAQAITQHADSLLFLSSLDFTPEEEERLELLQKSEELHKQAAESFSRLFLFHDAGENHWRIGQIHLLRNDFIGAQENFNEVQKAFNRAAELLPDFAEAYSIFSTYGVTLVGLIDGLKIIDRGDYSHAALLFDDLAKELEVETERSLRQLRQLLIALNQVCQFAATKDEAHRENAKSEFQRLLGQLTPDAYEQQLPYSLHKTIHRLLIFLVAPKLFFPRLLLDLPIQEKMLAMVQTRHIVGTAMNMYQATVNQRDTPSEQPTEDVIRSYVARISNILDDR
jgi:tetratricopeptide (TPR) repeat protein